jgi:hypothetical protein
MPPANMSASDSTATAPTLRQRTSAYLQERPRLRRELYFAAGALGAGFIALPLLIYLAGSLTLGNYESGGLGAFLADFFGGLFRGWPPAWGVVLGPYALVLFLRLCRLIWRRVLTRDDVA